MKEDARSKERPPVESWLPTKVRPVVVVLAAIYLAALQVSTTGLVRLDGVLPGAVAFFAEIAGLFPEAAVTTIDYRAEGWSCADRAWKEIDTRPYFPMRAEDKENRFYRFAHFYRSNEKAILELESYLVARVPTPIGGIRLVSLRIPFAAPGGAIERYRRKALSDIPPSQVHEWYTTLEARRLRRCGDPRKPAAGE